MLLQDEHFVVWMRAAALRNFRKLWGRIDQDIPAGANVTVQIQNRWPSIHVSECQALIGAKLDCSGSCRPTELGTSWKA